MAQIINTPGRTEDASGGWAVALIVLVAVIVLGFFFLRGNTVTPGTPNTGSQDINVTIPGTDNGGTDGIGNTGGGTGTGSGSQNPSGQY